MEQGRDGLFGAGEAVDPAAFTGEAWLTPLAAATPQGMPTVADVRFAPGARNHWHSHSVGQVLLVEDGQGYCEIAGQPARLLGPGDVVQIPPGAKHWHGAGPTTWFSHIAITGGEVTWMEPVTDQHYAAVTAQAPTRQVTQL